MNKFRNIYLSILIVVVGILYGCTSEKIKPISEHNIIPLPVSVSSNEGTFELNKNTKILISGISEGIEPVAMYFQEFVKSSTGLGLEFAEKNGKSDVVFEIDNSLGLDKEAYILDISKNEVKITAAGAEGLFYGVQTLRQLLPAKVEAGNNRIGKLLLPVGKIKDKPEYAYRGMMLDVARHFFSVEDVKHLIDLLAKYKVNFLHLGLSNDQGWRIEIKSWPLLTKIGGRTQVGGGAGGFYTQEEYKDLVAYAASRFITIVPEIDVPGHTNSVLASYGMFNPGIKVPEEGAVPVDRDALGLDPDPKATPLYTGIEVGFSTLNTNLEVTYDFLDDVIRELAEMTPGPYIHIGGDESLVTAMEDYIPFMENVQDIVLSYGKKSIGWDEIAHAEMLSSTVAQYWALADNAAMAIAQGAKVLISPAKRAYLDMKYDSTTHIGLKWAGFIELDDAYNWDPTTLDERIRREHILGVEAALWTETIANREEMEYMLFPRLPAIAEISWTPKNQRSWESFANRIVQHGNRWSAMGLNYYPSPRVIWE